MKRKRESDVCRLPFAVCRLPSDMILNVSIIHHQKHSVKNSHRKENYIEKDSSKGNIQIVK